MSVCVVGGTGYVGLITGLGLAEAGHDVINVDIDEARVRQLQSGDLPIVEAGLRAVLQRNLEAGRIRFITDLAAGVRHGDIIFITVATPATDDGQADLSRVIQVAMDLRRYLAGYKVIVVKSTVPVGTVELVASFLREEKREGIDFDIVANPEFLREGEGLHNFLYPDRIVIGTRSERARRLMRELYRPVITRQVPSPGGAQAGPTDPVPIVETDLASAQMIKYASNAFLATRISFINEIASLCERVGADIKDVTRGMGYDPRIGHRYLYAGLGFGGPCLEKDLRALVNLVEGDRDESRLLRSVLEHNERQVRRIITKVTQLVGNPLSGKTIAVFGLAFKAGTNDVRNSLALRVMEHLEREGAVLHAHDPVAMPETQALKPHLACHEDPYEAVRGAVALLILTDWPQFRVLDYQHIKQEMARPHIIDGRNLLDPDALQQLGFTYVGIGTGAGAKSSTGSQGREYRIRRVAL